MTPSISVVIPLYNKASYIAEAVRSAHEQTCPPLEIIVVDDGSTDGSGEIVRRLPYANLRVITIPNSGVSVARNTGIEAACGDYIALLDADDWWSPWFLQAIHRLIRELPGCSIYGTGSIEVYPGGRLPDLDEAQVMGKRAEHIRNYFKERARRVLMNNSSMVVPRRFFTDQGIRFAPGEANGEDHDVWFQLAERAPLAFLDLPLAAYRRGVAQSLTQRFAWERLEPAYVRLWQRTCSDGYPRDLRRAARHLVHRRQTSFARNRLVRANDRLGALHCLFFENHLPGASLYWWSTLVGCLVPSALRRQFIDQNRGWKDHQIFARLLRRSSSHP